jgi:DNA adenine methylase
MKFNKMPFQTDLFNFDNENRNEFDYIRNLNFSSRKIVSTPQPYLKWVGGKRQLISQIHKYLPAMINKYIEPFLGGGSMLFYLLPNKAIISDINSELINCYKVINSDIGKLLEHLEVHKQEYYKRTIEERKKYYYQLRELDREEFFDINLTPIERASRTIFLNKTCFNGLYRVNSKGQFNSPFGYYKKPMIYEKNNLLNISKLLQNVIILNCSYEEAVKYAKKGDFIYFDPPYHPISNTSSFTSYSKERFGEEEQIKLAKTFSNLDNKGCKVMLSNSHCDFTLELYKDYNINIIEAKRSINSDGNKRGKIKEILVMNDYECIGDRKNES